MMNIMVTDDANISGILDWEEAYWLPFGMNTHVIARLAGYNRRGAFTKREYSDEMEVAFWLSLFHSAPVKVMSLIPTIQLAKDIGYVLSVFHDASHAPHPSHIGVFDDIMGYKVPEDLSIVVRKLSPSLVNL
jgi:hypothetical protein